MAHHTCETVNKSGKSKLFAIVTLKPSSRIGLKAQPFGNAMMTTLSLCGRNLTLTQVMEQNHCLCFFV
jgi:hypothetical protein